MAFEKHGMGNIFFDSTKSKLAEFLPGQAFRQETAEYLMESCIFHRFATAATAGTDFNINPSTFHSYYIYFPAPFTFHLYYIYFPARSHVHAVKIQDFFIHPFVFRLVSLCLETSSS